MSRHRRVFTTVGNLLAVGLLSAQASLAQQKLLSIEDLYDPEKRVDFTGSPPTELVWLNDAQYLWQRVDQRTRIAELLRVEATTGKSEPFFDVSRMEAALTRLPGVTKEEARRLSHQPNYTMNARRTATVLTLAGDLYCYEFGTDTARRLTSSQALEEQVSFSPDGRLVAFVREHNIYLVEVASSRERQLTTDGHAQLLNGKLDWVYQEEIYGRGSLAYWWSPDSSRVAYLQLDEKPVAEFTVVDHVPYRLEIETTDYPLAGDPNPIARLGVVGVAGEATWVDTGEYNTDQLLIVGVGWTPDSRRVAFEVQDREQTWLDLKLADPATGQSTRVLRETTKAWVDSSWFLFRGNPRWLGDGSFLWASERTGWRHLYHYAQDGTLIRQITNGRWEVRDLYGVDETRGWIYFAATERSHIGLNVYRVRLDGSGFTRLSEAAGDHQATFDPSFSHYLGTWSDVTTPPQVRLHRADGVEVRVIHEGKVPALAEYRLGKPEFVQVLTRDGFVMEAMMIKPPDFDPSRRYPVFQYTYAGPQVPLVANAWRQPRGMMFRHLLAQRGVIVWICDNRTASGKGAESAWPMYKNVGELELRDIEDGLAWLKQQPFVDGSRIGIFGWSNGGFMVSYALTHSKSFAMGIAGAPVTDWRDYDTILTERFMLTPQNNPDGYRKSAPRFAAQDLHGRLLLIHGAMDDNVHLQNTLQFAYELQKAGKQFDLMVYPRSRHQIVDPLLQRHMYTMIVEYVQRHLQPGSWQPAVAP